LSLSIDDVVGRDVPVQDVVPVDVAQRLEDLGEQLVHILGAQPVGIVLDDVEQRFAVDEIHRHVGGVVVAEELVHADDVGMLKRGERAGLLLEQFENRAEFILAARRPQPHRLPRPAAHGRREAFLDDHAPPEAVARQVGHAETAGIQIPFNHILPGTQLRAGGQLIAV
jgi:hypothetical protein